MTGAVLDSEGTEMVRHVATLLVRKQTDEIHRESGRCPPSSWEKPLHTQHKEKGTTAGMEKVGARVDLWPYDQNRF